MRVVDDEDLSPGVTDGGRGEDRATVDPVDRVEVGRRGAGGDGLELPDDGDVEGEEEEEEEDGEVSVDGGLGVWNSSESVCVSVDDGGVTGVMVESDWGERGAFMNFTGRLSR